MLARVNRARTPVRNKATGQLLRKRKAEKTAGL